MVKGAANEGGWTVALLANPLRLSPEQRHAVVNTVDVPRFVSVLLAGEAATATARPVTSTPLPAFKTPPAVAAPLESPPTALFLPALQRTGAKLGIALELRQGEFNQILAAYATSDFDVLVRLQPSTPETCWVCEASGVDAVLTSDADARKPGAVAALTTKLKDDGVVVPLWRERPVVAARDGLRGVSANGFAAAGPAWNLETWSWTR